MFKFLKLRKSDSGDARRHVPFTSIINKHVLPLFLSFILVLFSSTQKVYAVDIPLPPVWLPMNPYNSDALHNNYVLLNDDQKKIAKEIMGAYGSVFLGLAANPLQNPIDTVLNARSWLQEYGSTFLNTIFDSTVQAPRAMQDLVGSVTYKASTYNSYDDYVSDTSPSVSSGSEKYFQFTPELTVAYKNWFAVYGDVYNWQLSAQPINVSDFDFSWSSNIDSMSGSQLESYNNMVNNLGASKVKMNCGFSSWKSAYLGSSLFSTYKYIFVNLSNNTVYLCDELGNKAPNSFSSNMVYRADGYNPDSWSYNIQPQTINFSQYHKLIDLFNDINNDTKLILSSGSAVGGYTQPYQVCLSDWVSGLYIGTSWDNRQPWTMVEDLNIGLSNSAYIDNVGDDAFVNINGLIGYLGSDVTDVREGVFENTLVREGDHAIELTDSILKAIDRAVEETKSGIVIPTDVFSSLFDGGKGFISYMWYMTKPLVIYTRDLLDLLTFDPVNGFNASGPGYFILGVVGLGVIGGVIVKFLL